MKKIKVLHMVNTMDIGGIESLLINLVHNIDKTKYQFDFLLWCEHESYYENEIKKCGGKVYKIKLSHNPLKDIFIVKKFLRENKYDVVHSHSLFYSGFFMLAAKLSNVKVRISHIHSISDNHKNNFLRKVYKFICKKLMKKYSTYCCACSEEAAIYGFDKITDKVIIINNCIDVNKYIDVNLNNVQTLKDKYFIKEDDLIIGNVGHLSIEKNQKFIIDIMKKLKNEKKMNNIKCLFIGDGNLKEQLELEINEKSINDNIIFVGQVNNIPEYLKLMDIFVFPSLYEGFGMALLEAQAAGIYSIASKNVPPSTDMGLGLVKYLPIDEDNIDKWVNEIINYKKININSQNIKENISQRGYDISSTINKLSKLYIQK